jgi:hypothetical protein
MYHKDEPPAPARNLYSSAKVSITIHTKKENMFPKKEEEEYLQYCTLIKLFQNFAKNKLFQNY